MEPTRILLVDLSHLFWTHWHSTKDQAIGAAFESTIDKIARLREGFQFVAVCCDAPPYKRKELFPGYKMNREAAPPTAVAQLERVKERLASDGLLLWSVRGQEADDVIATAASRALKLDEPVRVTIASNDKDLLQLVRDPYVVCHSPMSGVTMTESDVFAKFGVMPDRMGDFLALVGDTSDNIAGVPGVGPKNAAKLLQEFGDLDGVLTRIGDSKPSAIRESVLASDKIARLARKLVELDSNVPLNFEELFEQREPKQLVEMDMAALDSTDEEESDSFNAIGPEATPLPEPTPAPPPQMAIEKAKPNSSGNGHKLDVSPRALPFEMQLQPSSLTAAAALGAALHNSRMFSSKFANAETITAVILRGREMGLTALTACSAFHFFESQLVMSAHLIVAKAEEHPDCEWLRFVNGDSNYAEYECKHRAHPEPTRLRYTIEQAKQAGLCPEVVRTSNPTPGEKDRRGNWEKRPAEMLRKTAAAQLVRVMFPSAALGILATEEMIP